MVIYLQLTVVSVYFFHFDENMLVIFFPDLNAMGLASHAYGE